MLILCFSLLSLTVLLGASLLAGHFRRFAWVHGAIGALGSIALAFASWHALGLGKIGGASLALLAVGLCGGVLIAVLQWRGRPAPGLVLFLHAIFGGLAYLLLAGIVFR
jgi:chromate transport protein ChrA